MFKLGMVSSFHPHSMCERVERVTAKTGRTSCIKWTNSFRSIRVSDENSSVTWALQCFLNLFQLQTSIQSEVINFQHVLTSFAVFQSFTDLFRELNDCEIDSHQKINSENVGTWHGIIISPAQHVQKSRDGHGENWTHLVYKLDRLFRSIWVSDENSSVTLALHFFKLITTLDFFAFRTHHSKRRHQFPACSDIICGFSVIYRFVQRAK